MYFPRQIVCQRDEGKRGDWGHGDLAGQSTWNSYVIAVTVDECVVQSLEK